MSAKEPTPQESNGTAPDALGVEKRTRRACVESMTIHSHGGGSGMFDVYSESGSEYVIDLRDDVCTCPDFTHREPAGGCKHIRRVRLEFGIEDVPAGIRSKHAAPTDVELARQRRGIGVEENENKSEPEPEPKIEAKPVEQGARAVVTDGGQVLKDSKSEPERESEKSGTGAPVGALEVNRIAAKAVANAGGALADFDVFCVTVEATQDTLLRTARVEN